MKIGTDVNQVLSNPASIQTPRHVQQQNEVKAQAAATDNYRIEQSLSERLNVERSLNDALNIAQTSHALIQKAMTISSRLLNIANETIVTGRSSDTEVRNVLSDIQASMRQHGEIVSNPPTYATGASELPPLPQAGNDITGVIGMAEDYLRGNTPDTGSLNVTGQNLAGHLRQAGNAVSQIQSRLQTVTEAYSPAMNLNPQQLLGETVNLISGNPSRAISIQGNISHESAVRILGA